MSSSLVNQVNTSQVISLQGVFQPIVTKVEQVKEPDQVACLKRGVVGNVTHRVPSPMGFVDVLVGPKEPSHPSVVDPLVCIHNQPQTNYSSPIPISPQRKPLARHTPNARCFLLGHWDSIDGRYSPGDFADALSQQVAPIVGMVYCSCDAMVP